MTGKVKWFSGEKNYGFIEGRDLRDYFVHGSEVKDDGQIFEGDKVEFDIEETTKGKQATNVVKIKE